MRSDAAVFFNGFCYIKTTKDVKVSTERYTLSRYSLPLNPVTV